MRYFFVFLFMLAGHVLLAQVTSTGDGLWTADGIWTGGVSPTAANSDGIVINHQITVPTGTSIDVDQVTIGNGGVLIIQSGATVTVLAGAGTDLAITGSGVLDVDGTLVCNNEAEIIGTTILNTSFASGATYQLLSINTQGSIPTATWDPNSTFRVSGYTGQPQFTSVWSQAFGNVVLDFPGSALLYNFQGNLNNIAGDLILNNSNDTFIGLTLATAATINIGGDVIVMGQSRIAFNNAAIGTVVNIGGDFNYITSNTAVSTLNGAGTCTINIGGNFNIDPQTQGLVVLATQSGQAGASTFNIQGDFLFDAGTLQENGQNSTVQFNFIGSTPQSYVRNTLQTTLQPSNAFSYAVQAGSTLNVIGNSVIDGAGTLVVNGTLGLGSTATGGAIQNSAGGNIHITPANRTFANGSTVVYNGSAVQYMGNGHPSSSGITTQIANSFNVNVAGNDVVVGGNLVISAGSINTSGVTPRLTINGNLIMQPGGGNLNLGFGASLVLNGSVTPNGNFITSTQASNITINGTGNFGAFPFPPIDLGVNNFTLNRPGGTVIIDNTLTINGIATLTSGTLQFNHDLLVFGTVSSTSGLLSASPTSSLYLAGTNGNLGTLNFDPAGNTLANLTMSRSGGSASLGTPITVTGTLNLSNGNLTNGGGITVANGVVVSRNSNSELLQNGLTVAPGGQYHVTYTGGNMSTGLEFPLASAIDVLGNVTIDGGPVVLNQDVTVNGSIQLISGALNGGDFSITMQGPLWSFGGGTFSGNGQITFTASTEITGSNGQLPGIQIEDGASLVLPGGNTSISGDLLLIGSGVLDAPNSTITLNGDGPQAVSLEGASLNNLTVTKTGGDVELTSALNITGRLAVQSTTDFLSNGFLTLISTSDATTGNASIGSLLNGGSVTGDVTVQRYMSGEGRIYRYLSSPVANASVADWQDDFPITGTFGDPSTIPGVPNPLASMFYYDETVAGGLQEGWIPYPTSGNASENPLEPGRGYSAFIRESDNPTTWEVTGTVNQGTIAFPVTYENNDAVEADGWNLVGNPYPSSIDWDTEAGWTRENIAETIVIRENGAGNFLYWDGSVGDIPNGIIATGQAFWVRATGIDPVLAIQEEAKSTSTGELFREGPADVDYLEVIVRSDKVFDKAYFRQRDGAQDGLDKFDAPKFQNDRFSVSILSESKAMAISAVGEITCTPQIPLRIEFRKDNQGNFLQAPAGNYEMEINRFGRLRASEVLIYDNYLDHSTPLVNNVFAFTIEDSPESYNPDRFSLQISDDAPNLLLAASGDEIICAQGEAIYTLHDTEPLVKYTLLVNGIAAAEAPGTGNDVQFRLPADHFNAGQNSIRFKAGTLCDHSLATSITVDVEPVYEVSSKSASVVCHEGSSTLEANGAPADGYYNWYLDETSQEVFARQQEPTLISPVVDRSQTFYVAIENSLGCEGQRVAVPVNVANYDDVVISSPQGNVLKASYSSGLTWYLDGVKLPQTGPEITLTESGVYRVEANISGCITSAEQEYIVTGTEGLVEQLFSVYPNPADNHLSIRFENGVRPDAINIIDLTGRSTALADVNNDTGIQDVDISALPSGVYHVVLHYGNRRLSSRLVKK